MPTRSLGFQSFYQAQLTAAISDTDLTIPLDVLPTPSEGILVIESTSSTKREIIYYTSKTATAVVCPAGAGNGRGYDGTTAVSHLQNSAVIMAPVAQMFKSLQDGSSMSSTINLQNVNVSGSLTVGGQTPTADWSQLASAPNTVAANGNRSYTLTFNGVDYTGTMQPGTRVRTTRTVAAPTQCTSLNGTTQYYSRASASVAGMTFTTTATVSAWIKLTSYGTNSGIASRYNGTNGWIFYINTTGQVAFQPGSTAAGISYQSIPLNKWVHVAASYNAGTVLIYIDGVLVSSSGSPAASLTQAGNLEIGSFNGSSFFPGKIAQVAIYSAVISAATILASVNQTLTGSETSLISAFSFNNSINDLNTTNANNLTANGSAVATNADSPFGGQGLGTISSTLDYGIIQSISFSTNTTAVVQVPEGCTIPTSGGVAALYYSTNKVPYGMPISEDKWTIDTVCAYDIVTGASPNLAYTGLSLNIPTGKYLITLQGIISASRGASGTLGISSGISTSSSAYQLNEWSSFFYNATASDTYYTAYRSAYLTLTSQTPYYWLLNPENGGVYSAIGLRGSRSIARLSAKNAYL